MLAIYFPHASNMAHKTLFDKLFCYNSHLFSFFHSLPPFFLHAPFLPKGIANSYLFLQVALWGTFHALGLCWIILFPFHYRRFKIECRIKYIHITTLIIGLVLPAIFALVPLTDGYTLSQSPTDSCLPRNMVIVYYTLTLPISILMAASSTGLLILFWTILKVPNSCRASTLLYLNAT